MAEMRTCPLGVNYGGGEIVLHIDDDLFRIVSTDAVVGDKDIVALTRENARRLKRVLDAELGG